MTDWLSAAGMLITGLIVGFMFLYGMKRRQSRTDIARADLEAKRDALLARLREDPSDRRLELETAEVLRKLDGLKPSVPSVTSVVKSNEKVKGFVWGAASMAVLAAIGFFVVQQAKPKQEATAQPADDLTQLKQQVNQTPDNLSLRDDLAKAYLNRDDLSGVAEQTQYVLQRNPNDPRALTYQALVHIAARRPDAAAAMLDRATRIDPNLIDAWVGLAWLNAEAGNLAGAQSAIDEAKKRHPEQSARLDELMSHLHPQTPLHITLNLGTGVPAPSRGVIFITARAEGVTAGPPAAVKRLPLSAFPVSVDLTAADSMMGQALPAKMRIEARVDRDGDPLTKDPNDPAAVLDGVVMGQSISLTLK